MFNGVLVEALGGGVLVWRMCFLTDSQFFVLDAFFLWRVLSADSSSGLRNVHCPPHLLPPPKTSSTSIAHFCKIVESGEGSLNWNRVWLPMFLLFCIKEAPWSMATVIGKPQDKKTKFEPHNLIAKDIMHSGRQATLILRMTTPNSSQG